MLMTVSYLAFIEGLGEEGLVPFKDASRVRKLIQLLDVIVLDIGPEHDDDNGSGGDGGKIIQLIQLINIIVLDTLVLSSRGSDVQDDEADGCGRYN